MPFEFMLAASAEVLENLCFPLLASPKIDGVRGGVRDGMLIARSLKPIPNAYTQSCFGRHRFDGLDGELTVGKVTAEDVFRKTTSAVMSIAGEPNVALNVFDHTLSAPGTPFKQRLEKARALASNWNPDGIEIRVIEHKLIVSVGELLRFEKQKLNEGYEGLVLRNPEGVYKHGRSTLREGGLLRLTRTIDSEAVVLAVTEGETNTNAKTLESKGRAKRSSHAAGKVPNGMLGTMLVKDLVTGVEFDLGTGEGLTVDLRKQLWARRRTLVGKVAKYRSKAVGVKSKPRQPIWIGWRDKRDM